MTFDTKAGHLASSMSPSPSSSPSIKTALETLDTVVLVVYFIAVLAVGFWSMWRTKRSTVDGYFLAGKSMSWWPVDMYAGALFIKLAVQWDTCFAVGLLSVTALNTVAGGLAAVIYTDAVQTAIMLVGALILMGFSFAEVGGLNALMEGYANAIPSVHVPNSTCGILRDDAFHLFRDPLNSDLPWPGIIIGMSIPSMWYWCSDQ
ncbi:hypothetical protein LDENG_00053890, partial [Lucifuga dentata]